MEKCLVAVDLSYQTYRAAAANPNLTSADGVFTGGLYGFLVTLAKTLRETQATHLVLCKDSKPYVRSKDYPEYKLLRKKSANEELLQAMKLSLVQVTAVMTSLGMPILELQGYESDDIIAHCLRTQRHRFAQLYAASNDSDLFQLLEYPNIAIYAKDIATCHTAGTLQAKHAVTPQEYMLATAIAGTHNDVAGVPGVGIVTAIKAIREPLRMRALQAAHGDVIARNLDLIQLPHPTFPRSFKIQWPQKNWFDARRLYRLLSEYGIETTAAMVAAFEQIK